MSAANARQKYETFLEVQRQQKKSETQQRKRKCTLEEIEGIKEKNTSSERS